MLANFVHLLTNTAVLFAHKMKVCLVHIHKPVSAQVMLPSMQFCAVFVKDRNPYVRCRQSHHQLQRLLMIPGLSESLELSCLAQVTAPPPPSPTGSTPLIYGQLPVASVFFPKTQHCFNVSSCLANRTPNKALLVFVCQAGKLCVDSSPPPKPPPLPPHLLCFTTDAAHCSCPLPERAHHLPQLTAIHHFGRLKIHTCCVLHSFRAYCCCGCNIDLRT